MIHGAMKLGATIGLTLCLTAPLVRAEVATHDLTFHHSEQAFDKLYWDTGYLPKDEKIQVRFEAGAKGELSTEMPTTATLESGPLDHKLLYTGKPDQGRLRISFLSVLKLYLRFELEIEGFKITYDGPLPLPSSLEDLNKSVTGESTFTPLALPGANGVPVQAEINTPKFHVYTLEVPIQVNYGFIQVKAKIPIHVQAHVRCDFQGKEIETQTAAGDVLPKQTAAGQATNWPNDGQLQQEGWATYRGERDVVIAMSIFPSIVLEAKLEYGPLSVERSWKVAEFEISQDLLTFSEDWTFEPQGVSFQLTEQPPDTNPAPTGEPSANPDTPVAEPPGPASSSPPESQPKASDPVAFGDADQPRSGSVAIYGGCSITSVGQKGLDGTLLLLGLLGLFLSSREWRPGPTCTTDHS